MNVILLSGGSGTRLWPLSNDIRSKQFLKVLVNSDGELESMVQHMYRCIKLVDPNSRVLIAAPQNQVPLIKLQLGEDVDISVEPCRRDTFPAIALATAYFHDIMQLDENDSIVVCPVDPNVDFEYFEKLEKLSNLTDNANLVLMGIQPTYPSEKYGYILPTGSFTEKPSEEKAKELIDQGALWNAGVFSYKLGYLKKKTEELAGTFDYYSLLNNYQSLKKQSFDYAVAEHENNIKVIKYSGKWEDLGTWNSLTSAMSDNTRGTVVLGENCENVHAINELSIPIVVLGMKNAAVIASPDGILITDKDKSSKLKNYIPKQRPMYEQRFWGEYKILDYSIHDDGKNSLTKHLVIKENKNISYQRHLHRMEMWTFTEGNGILVIDGCEREVKRGDSIVIPEATMHAIKATNGDLHIIEVQIGDELSEEDIERFDYEWRV